MGRWTDPFLRDPLDRVWLAVAFVLIALFAEVLR